MALDKNVPLVTNTIAEDLIAINANWEAIVSDTAYDATTWDGVTDVAPSKNAIRDKLEALIPSGTIMLFGQASAPTGWTKKTNWQDKAMFTYNGDANGTALDSGGSVAAQTAHTHTGPSHTHTGPSHTHTYTQVPNHVHPLKGLSGTGAVTYHQIGVGGAYHSSPSTDDPTGGVATGTTAADGTGATGAEGTGATGANTAFFYQELIVCTKD
uniref:Uncharacterized protein n=1 Tax=viral metagenome TaxID=1070528 RepID=A0A6H1ZNB1_9ZZZZ